MCTFYLKRCDEMNQDEYYMKEALKEALKAYKKQEVPVGVVITLNNKIIARGHNLRETKKLITKHAELIAIEKASKKLLDWRLNNCYIYITLFPCPMCASAIAQSRIAKVIVGTPSQDKRIKEIGKKIFLENDTKIDLKIGVLEKDCREILTTFFKEQRKKC